jgi:hypothetical protein
MLQVLLSLREDVEDFLATKLEMNECNVKDCHD